MSQGANCLVAALVLLLCGCAAVGGNNTVPPSVDVSGKWAGTWSFHNPTMGSGDVFMNLKQSGADASGDLRVTGPTPAEPTYFEGTVSGSSVILKVPYLSGTLDVSGDEMKGVINGIMPANVSLRRQR
jgi:hypothetical protein